MSLVFNMNCINGVLALEGMLCVYSTHIRRGIHTFKLWILKDYDVKESWNRLLTIQGTDLYSIQKYKFSDGEVLLRCRDLECGSVFKTSKESSRLWPQSVSEPIQDGFVYTERKRVMKHSEINKMDVDGTMEILSRLPVRSLLRFKCVSKFWMALISEPYFTLKHLNHVKNDQNSQRFLVNQWSSLYCSSLSSVQRIEEVQKLDCPSNTELWRCFLYCCYDSLELIWVYNYRDHTHQLWLWIPSTRESIVLPGPKFPPELFCTWGLGYDSVSDDYKILKIDLKSRSEILTLKSGSWRLMNKYPTDILPALFCTDSLVFAHGAFHWIDDITRFTVTVLSMSSEVYTEIPLPEQMLSIYNQTWGVSVLTEKLCAYAHYMFQTFRFWVMKDYGVKESWTKLFTLQVAGFLLVIPKYRFSDGELLLC
ncbi:putative pentatricopeptide repeat-containing protein-like [Capsicum annuum]|nr:putative pentatricopeptide repeat-containing protein-like [Capsicum annuum]